jgi:hypothetical protein
MYKGCCYLCASYIWMLYFNQQLLRRLNKHSNFSKSISTRVNFATYLYAINIVTQDGTLLHDNILKINFQPFGTCLLYFYVPKYVKRFNYSLWSFKSCVKMNTRPSFANESQVTWLKGMILRVFFRKKWSWLYVIVSCKIKNVLQ